MEALVFWGAIGAAAVVLVILGWIGHLWRQARAYRLLLPHQRNLRMLEAELQATKEKIEKEREVIHLLAQEKSQGFPWLAKAYADYFELQDLRVAADLESKSHPARKAAERVREISLKRKTAEQLRKMYEYIIEYYEALFPWLTELRDENIDDLLIQITTGAKTDQDEVGQEDSSRRWLTDGEWRSLSSAQRSDLALTRWKQGRRSKWEIGRDYERYIGYRMEQDRYKVSYQGIIEGLADLGRDLVCVKGPSVEIIQCKHWSQHKQIHEKHIFQLYGSVVAYRIDHPGVEASGKLVTSTRVSDRAKMFARALDIGLEENHSLRDYPLVKCNVSRRDGERIYHLPFDQQYDTTFVEPERSERYVSSAREAETLGFRRAYWWRGNLD